MAHVVLLYPHHGRNREQDHILPLSLLHLAAPLVAHGHDATIIDQRVDPDWRATLARALARPQTVAVGISTMTGPQIAYGLEMAAAVRDSAPGLAIVWGGVHPSLLPDQTARHPLVDVVVVGEGETPFTTLIDAIAESRDWRALPGLCYADGGRVVQNPLPDPPDLDSAPPLPYQLFDLDKYRVTPLRSSRPSLPLSTSRGCRFRCAYCYNTQFSLRKWRGMSPGRVLAEIRRLGGECDSQGVFLLDDNFFQDIERARQIMKLIVDARLGTKIYNANCRVDALSRMTPGDLALMAGAGIEQLFIGVESGSPAVLKAMLKDITVEQVLAVNEKLRDTRVMPVYSFMAGLPGETRQDVEMTLDLMMRLKDTNPRARFYKLALYTPFPGTALFDQCIAMGNVFPRRLEDWAAYDYDHINLTWLNDGFRRFLDDVSQLSGFLDVTDKVTGPLAIAAKAYSKVAAIRCRQRWFGWMPEIALIRLMRSRHRATAAQDKTTNAEEM
jgi:anaerobic magnesium-protoporphyrin IX monomethyl ester cyclase